MKTCHECAHHRFRDTSRWALTTHRNTWWNQLCSAAERPGAVDPVTGDSGYLSKNDLGRQYVGEQQYEFCRDINRTGDCPMWKAKP